MKTTKKYIRKEYLNYVSEDIPDMKLLSMGRTALTDSDLLAIIVGSKEKAVKLLQLYDSIENLAKVDLTEIARKLASDNSR